MMRPLIIAGLDPSLTSFGVAVSHGPEGHVLLDRVRPGVLRGHERLTMLLADVGARVTWCDLIVIEGLSFAAKGNAMTDLAGLHWLIRQELWNLRIPYAVVTPATRAKYITGKGNAGKDECLAAVVKRFPGLDVHGNDEADALTLAQMGADAYGQPLVQMPKDRTELLHARSTAKGRKGQPVIIWPDMSSAMIH